MKRLRRKLRQDDGIGIASALAISVVIFILGATWYSVSVHELEEVSYDRHLATAVNVAEAGAREAMYLLASNDGGFRDAADGGQATTGISGTTCVLNTLETTVDGTSEVQGEYWVRVSPLAAARQYLIESWGWAPGHLAHQAVPKKVMIEVELVPIGGGFYYALFASDGGLTAGNRKEIYGDAYSGGDLALDNFTRVYANDGGAPGTGQMLVYRDLTIGAGSNIQIAGEVKVNGFVQDDKGSDFGTGGNDLIILNDTTLSSFSKSAFKKNKATVGRNLQVAGPASSVTDPPSASSYVWNATGIQPVPPIGLPQFVWVAGTYAAKGLTEYTHNTWADFDTWYNANDSALTGAHYVEDTGSYTLRMDGATLDTDFVLAFEGDLELRGTPSGVSDPAVAPVTVVIAGVEPTSDVSLAQTSNSIEGQVHHLIYAGGTFAAAQQTTIYGAMYGNQDDSANRLEIHFRPPSDLSISGFTFDPALADSFIPRPGVWREIPPDALGCTLP
jgi:hypothetical protein